MLVPNAYLDMRYHDEAPASSEVVGLLNPSHPWSCNWGVGTTPRCTLASFEALPIAIVCKQLQGIYMDIQYIFKGQRKRGSPALKAEMPVW